MQDAGCRIQDPGPLRDSLPIETLWGLWSRGDKCAGPDNRKLTERAERGRGRGRQGTLASGPWSAVQGCCLVQRGLKEGV